MHILYSEVSNLKPIEGFISDRANWLEEKILSEQKWTTPIVIDNKHGLVMDGHHRFEVAKRISLKLVPIIACSYSEVEVYSLRDDEIVTVDQIIENHLNGIIYPNKTAKHNFYFHLPENLEVPLERLR